MTTPSHFLPLAPIASAGRAERASATDPEVAHHPLNAAGVLLQPSFGEPISKAKQPELAFAVSLLVDSSDKPGADGRLLQVSRLPSTAIPVGSYELAVTVTSGDANATRSPPFTLVD